MELIIVADTLVGGEEGAEKNYNKIYYVHFLSVLKYTTNKTTRLLQGCHIDVKTL